MKDLAVDTALKRRGHRLRRALGLDHQTASSALPAPTTCGRGTSSGEATGSSDNWAAAKGEASDFTPPSRDAGEGHNSTALFEQYVGLKGAVEGFARVINCSCSKVSPEAADLRRRAVAALYECATVTLRLSQVLGKAGGPSAATCRYLGTRIPWDASFNERAHEFLGLARNFALALTSCAQPDSSCSTRPGDRSPRESLQDCLAALSPTQQRVFNLLLKGLPNKLIAYELGLAESTVKTHLSSLFRKLHVRSRAHALALAADLERQKGLASELDSSRPAVKRNRGTCRTRVGAHARVGSMRS